MKGPVSQLEEDAGSSPVQCGFESHRGYHSYAYILGMYLGDGCISEGARTQRLRISLDDKYPEIQNRCMEALKILFPNNRVSIFQQPRRCSVVSVYSTKLSRMFPQHGAGRKHNRRIVLEEWQKSIVREFPRSFIRGLFHSDGCRYEESRCKGKYKYVMYNFSNMSEDIARLFEQACSDIDVRCTFNTTREGKHMLWIRNRASVTKLEAFLGSKL